jgi:hypothetical protein
MELDALTIALFNSCLRRASNEWELECASDASLKELVNKHDFFKNFITAQIGVQRETLLVQRDLLEGLPDFDIFNERVVNLSSIFRDFYWLTTEQFELFLVINDPENSTDIQGNIDTVRSNSL